MVVGDGVAKDDELSDEDGEGDNDDNNDWRWGPGGRGAGGGWRGGGEGGGRGGRRRRRQKRNSNSSMRESCQALRSKVSRVMHLPVVIADALIVNRPSVNFDP